MPIQTVQKHIYHTSYGALRGLMRLALLGFMLYIPLSTSADNTTTDNTAKIDENLFTVAIALSGADFNMARDHCAKAQYDKAEEYFTKAMKGPQYVLYKCKEPKCWGHDDTLSSEDRMKKLSAIYHHARGICRIAANNIAGALQDGNEVLKLDSSSSLYDLWKGLGSLEKGDVNAAQQSHQLLLKNNHKVEADVLGFMIDVMTEEPGS